MVEKEQQEALEEFRRTMDENRTTSHITLLREYFSQQSNFHFFS